MGEGELLTTQEWTTPLMLDAFSKAFEATTGNKVPEHDRITVNVGKRGVILSAYLRGCSVGNAVLPVELFVAIYSDMRSKGVTANQ